MLRGVDDRGDNLVIAREYISHGLPERAAELVTLDLGPRTDREIEARLRHDVDQERLTAIDRRLLRRMDPERTVAAIDNDPFQQSLAAGRLRKLKAMDLAEDIGGGRYRLGEGMEDTLRRMGERGDIIRLMQRELTARRLDRAGECRLNGAARTAGRAADPSRSFRRTSRPPLHDDRWDRWPGPLCRHRTREFCAVGARGRNRSDRTGNGRSKQIGSDRRCGRARQWRALFGRSALAHDANASEAFAASHVRRLEAMRRAGAGPERQADGSWVIPDDHLARAEAYARSQHRDRPVTLAVLSPTPVAELAVKEAPSWLDRELAEGASSAVHDTGFGREVRTALSARRQWLIEQQLATDEGRDFQLRRGAFEKLRQRELAAVGERLSGQLGKKFEQIGSGERVEGVIAQRVDLESGPHALVERSRDFALVPWRDVLERHVGKAASGIMRADGISWQFGRGRSGPVIS